MYYFYLSYPPSYQNSKSNEEYSKMVSCEDEIDMLFNIEPYEGGCSPYNYKDHGYKTYSKEKFKKIKKLIKNKYPKVKVVWSNREDSWK